MGVPEGHSGWWGSARTRSEAGPSAPPPPTSLCRGGRHEVCREATLKEQWRASGVYEKKFDSVTLPLGTTV